MILRILLAWLIVFCSIVGWSQYKQPKNQLLWEVSGNGLKKKSFLYGSLHSNDKRLFKFQDSLYVAMSQVQSIILETDIFSLFETWDTRKEVAELTYDNAGNPYTGNNRASETIYGSEDGMPQFMDAYFLEYCYNANKQFFSLEKIEDQLSLIEKWGQVELGNFEVQTTKFGLEKMIEFYLRGDIQSLDRMMKTNLSAFEGMYQSLIIDRNKLMAKGIDTLIRKQNALCVIGAGHLYGEEGVVELLRKKGYKLRKVDAVFSEEPISAKKDVITKRTYTFRDPKSGVTVIFPGKPASLKIWDNHPFLIYREMGQGNTYSVEIIERDSSLSLHEHAEIYIASPTGSTYKHFYLDDGTEVYEGLSDTYTEGVTWVRVMQSESHVLVLRAYGGNKFMSSNRPNQFFSRVWIE